MPSHVYVLSSLTAANPTPEISKAYVDRQRANAAARALLRRIAGAGARFEEWMNEEKLYRGAARKEGVKVRVLRVEFVDNEDEGGDEEGEDSDEGNQG